jgi:hypothetical protein
MAGPGQDGPGEPNPAQSGHPRRRRGRPTSQTVRNGETIWFRYTAHQWMRGRVISFGRHGLRVQVMGGELLRIVHVSWDDAHWHQPRGA